MKLRKLLLRCSADFQVRRAIGFPISLLRNNRHAPAILLGGVRLIRTTTLPIAVIAAPRDAFLVDSDSKTLQLLMRRFAVGRALGTDCIVSAGRGGCRYEPGSAQDVGGAGHEPLPFPFGRPGSSEPLPAQLSLLGAGTLALDHSCKMEKNPVTFSAICRASSRLRSRRRRGCHTAIVRSIRLSLAASDCFIEDR